MTGFAAPLLYLISFGPACWLSTRDVIREEWITRLYQPILQGAMRGPQPVRRMALRYAALGAKQGYQINFGLARDRDHYEANFHVARPWQIYSRHATP